MRDYASPETEPIKDLIAIHRVLTGYFSIVKDHKHYPIGGNDDLAAALLGQNSGKQAFLPADHVAFGSDGRLIDRWGTPIFVHPEEARCIELRSAGPDKVMFNEDDLVLSSTGVPK